ncbi:MAG: hypothetical protein GY711_03210 [bacterium]|nr:hypothetical protein [bacterium]
MSKLGAWIDDRWNPVLVKDVRQALRGRVFNFSFGLALALACLVTVFWATTGSQPNGAELYAGLLAILTLFNHLLIPLSTFRSLASEDEDGHLPHLVLSRLGPIGIVGGKLGAACVQIALCTSAFAPFLLMCSLGRGIGMLQIVSGLARHLATAIALVSAGLAFSLLAERRMARVIWQLALVALCLSLNTFLIVVMARTMSVVAMSYVTQVLVRFVGTAGYVVFLVSVAASRVLMPGENRSTILRAGTSAFVLLHAIAFFVSGAWAGGSFVLSASALLTMIPLTIVGGVLVTESPQLSRAEASWIRRHPRLPSIYAPGRDTAVAFLLVHYALLVLGTFAGMAGSGSGSSYWPTDHGFGAVIAAPLIVAFFLLIPSTVLTKKCATARGRRFARLATLMLLPLMVLGPPLASFLVGDHSVDLGHPLNPFYALGEDFWDGDGGATAALWLALSMPAVGVGLWRVVNGVRATRRVKRES